MKIKKIITISFLFLTKVAIAQISAPSLQWEKALGGSDGDIAFCVKQTSDRSYIVAGQTGSNNGNVSGNHGGYSDAWIVKLDSLGKIMWQRCFGGTDSDNASSILQTSDGGYIFAGSTESHNGDVTGFLGGEDVWIVKLNNLGIIQWQKCLGGDKVEGLMESDGIIACTSDGGYIITGFSYGNGGQVTGNHGDIDIWVVKVDSLGTLQWENSYGGSIDEYSSAIIQTTDGGYIVTGQTYSHDGNVSGNHGGSDIWIIKLNSTGTLVWQKCYGGSNDDIGRAIQQTTDFGYIVTGGTWSTDGDVSGIHGNSDTWVVKIDSIGGIQWQKCYGGSLDDYAQSIKITSDGDYIVGAVTHSPPLNGDVECNHGNYDYWILKLNSKGVLQWQKCLGGSYDDIAFSVNIAECGYIVAGSTISNDGDVTNLNGYPGAEDFWVVKLFDCSNASIPDSTTIFIPTLITPNGDEQNDSFIIPGLEDGSLEIYNRWGERIYKNENYTNKNPWSGDNAPDGIYYYSLYIKGKKQYKGWFEVLR
jgi:gliding motility-associated-like protein